MNKTTISATRRHDRLRDIVCRSNSSEGIVSTRGDPEVLSDMSESRVVFMKSRRVQRLARVAMGFGYGAWLGGLSFLCTGAGHGSYIPAGVSSAPFGVLGVLVSLTAAPVVWACLVFLVLEGKHLVFPLAIGFHYVSAVALLLFIQYGEDWDYVSRVPAVFILWSASYIAGQVVLWRAYTRQVSATLL